MGQRQGSISVAPAPAACVHAYIHYSIYKRVCCCCPCACASGVHAWGSRSGSATCCRPMLLSMQKAAPCLGGLLGRHGALPGRLVALLGESAVRGALPALRCCAAGPCAYACASVLKARAGVAAATNGRHGLFATRSSCANMTAEEPGKGANADAASAHTRTSRVCSFFGKEELAHACT